MSLIIMDQLQTFFESFDAMKAYCSQVAGAECIKYRCRNSGTYYKIFCHEPNCQFQITYNRRISNKSKDGFYLVIKGTCLEHQQNCPNEISNCDHTRDAKYISKKILPLFNERSPSINEIRSAIQCFNNENFSISELKYIKKLAKKSYFKNSTTAISQLIDFCKNLVSEHNWIFDLQFSDGILASIVLFPPWANNLIKYYHNPVITDATFSIENLRFISAVVVDGEGNTQAVGLVIRGTEDTKGYSILFEFISKIIGDNIITIIADMARCIRKAAAQNFKFYNFVFCFFHFKQNFLKKYNFKPSEQLWVYFQQFMKGEISYEFFKEKWFDEESSVNLDLRGFEYLSKAAQFFSPNNSTKKRGMVSSQRIEMLNNLMKKNGNSAFEMLRQFFHVSTSWFEKSATQTYPVGRILTNYAKELLIQIVNNEFLCEKFDDKLHYNKGKFECGCNFGNDLGIPCLYTIRLFRFAQVLKKNNKLNENNEFENNNFLNITLFHNEDFLKLISPEWLVSTFQNAFSSLTQREQPKFQIIPFENNDDSLNDRNLDILAAKIRWLCKNSPEYKNKIDKLLDKASEEIVFPFFDIKKPKEKKTKRHISSIEMNNKQKENDEVIDTLSRHLNGTKITRTKLYALSEHLIETNKNLPRINKSASKKDIIDWYRLNWKNISTCLGAFGCLAPNGSVVSENEDEFFLMDEDDID